MRLKSKYVLRHFADKWIAVSVDDSADQNNAFITMNKSGAFVWELLQNEISYDEIIYQLTKKYDVDKACAKEDLDAFLDNIRKAGMLNE